MNKDDGLAIQETGIPVQRHFLEVDKSWQPKSHWPESEQKDRQYHLKGTLQSLWEVRHSSFQPLPAKTAKIRPFLMHCIAVYIHTKLSFWKGKIKFTPKKIVISLYNLYNKLNLFMSHFMCFHNEFVVSNKTHHSTLRQSVSQSRPLILREAAKSTGRMCSNTGRFLGAWIKVTKWKLTCEHAAVMFVPVWMAFDGVQDVIL